MKGQETTNERPFLMLVHDLIVDLGFDPTEEGEDAHRHDPRRAPQQDVRLPGRSQLALL